MKKIILVANTAWYIYNFRKLLINDLKNNNFEVILVFPYDKKYSERLKSEGFKVINWKINRISINPFNSLSSIFLLYKIYSKEKPDIVNHFTIKPCIYGTVAAKFLKVDKCINSITGIGSWYENKNPKMQILLKILDPFLRIIFLGKNIIFIFQNIYDKEVFFKKKYAKSNNSFLIEGSGVDCNFFKSRKKKKYCKELNILFPSRIIKEKGIIELLEACDSVLKDGFNLKILIAGNIDLGNISSLSSKHLELIKENKNVFLLGHLDDMREAYEESHLVILPSWREGLSRSLIEASSMECPIVTTDVPGCKDIISHKINGLIVKVRNPNSLESAIRYAINNYDLAIEFGIKARLKAINRYDYRIINKQTIDLFF
tara:strand:+ start:46 stop:1164 length:1119 start_codon:yes stop_codon:yes gene_type:complete